MNKRINTAAKAIVSMLFSLAIVTIFFNATRADNEYFQLKIPLKIGSPNQTLNNLVEQKEWKYLLPEPLTEIKINGTAYKKGILRFTSDQYAVTRISIGEYPSSNYEELIFYSVSIQNPDENLIIQEDEQDALVNVPQELYKATTHGNVILYNSEGEYVDLNGEIVVARPVTETTRYDFIKQKVEIVLHVYDKLYWSDGNTYYWICSQETISENNINKMQELIDSPIFQD